MHKLNLLESKIESHFSNKAVVGDNYVKIHRLELYQEDLDFLNKLSKEQSVSCLVKRSGKGVTVIITLK